MSALARAPACWEARGSPSSLLRENLTLAWKAPHGHEALSYWIDVVDHDPRPWDPFGAPMPPKPDALQSSTYSPKIGA